jgi:hypothetical protein
MRKFLLIIFISLIWNSTSSTNEDIPIKEYFVTCEGIITSRYDDGFKLEEKFFQDIKIIFYDISKAKPNVTPALLRYERTSTNYAMVRPTEANFFVPRKDDKDFIKFSLFQELMLESGAPLIKDGWKDGIIEIYGGSSKTKEPKKNLIGLNNQIISWDEVLNLNLNTLTIKMEMTLAKPEVRASCSQNNELLNSLKNFSSNSSGVFKNILGKYLGK